MTSRYRGSFAGFVWVILNPILLYGVQGFVFQFILKIKVPNYFVFLLSGLLPWLFIVQSLDMCTNLFVASGRLLKSYPIHPLVCILAQVLDNFFNLTLLIAILFFPAIMLTGFSSWKFPLLIFPLLSCLIAVVGLAWLLATIQIFYRDVKFVLAFVLNISFFLTPIFYSEDLIDPKFHWIVDVNIFRHLILPFRALITDPIDPGFFKFTARAFVLACGLCALAAFYWKQNRNAAYVSL
jgi:ABC-type polysaccharide/polyol phosphate export permease